MEMERRRRRRRSGREAIEEERDPQSAPHERMVCICRWHGGDNGTVAASARASEDSVTGAREDSFFLREAEREENYIRH